MILSEEMSTNPWNISANFPIKFPSCPLEVNVALLHFIVLDPHRVVLLSQQQVHVLYVSCLKIGGDCWPLIHAILLYNRA